MLTPESVIAGAGASGVSCCDCAHLLALARQLTHTEYAYTLLAFEHGKSAFYQGGNVVARLVFLAFFFFLGFFFFLLFFFLTLGRVRSLIGGGARIGAAMAAVGTLYVEGI
jgi:hypothetical protein